MADQQGDLQLNAQLQQIDKELAAYARLQQLPDVTINDIEQYRYDQRVGAGILNTPADDYLSVAVDILKAKLLIEMAEKRSEECTQNAFNRMKLALTFAERTLETGLPRADQFGALVKQKWQARADECSELKIRIGSFKVKK